MSYETNDQCRCVSCPGEACNCGCQATAAPMHAAGASCDCGTACGCEAAEQGCLCER